MNRALGSMQANQINAVNNLLELYKRNAPPSDIERYFSSYGLELVKDKNIIQNIITSGKIFFVQDTSIGEFSSVEYNNSLFLNIKNNSFVVVFESLGTKNLNDPLWVGFLLTMAVLISLYLSIVRSFTPLKKLSKNIKKFAQGNLDVNLAATHSEDEIGQVAQEFNNAIAKIQELIRSRQLFLRTIMHELKTPIGKGRLITEMLDNETQKERLVNVFERLEILINEFAKIEQLLSKSYSLNYQDYHFSLILEQVKDMSMLDNWDELISTDIECDAVINVDFGLFALAIKNLIDNALKYSSDKKVRIICDENKVSVANRGAALAKSFEHYKQAFIRNKDEKATGMGLGLYIIDKICELHKFRFEYNYSDGTHYFSIVFSPKGAI